MKKIRLRDISIDDKESLRRRMEYKRHIHSNGCWTYGSDKLHIHGSICVQYKQYGTHVLSGYLYKDFSLESPLMTLHKCGNGGCWNPEHLYQGDHRQNMKDCIEDGGFPKSNMTSCKNGHKYTPGSYRIRRGWRECLACIRAVNYRRQKKLKENKNK